MSNQKPIHLPWNQYERYWVCLWPHGNSLPQALATQLTTLGFQKRTADRDYFLCVTGKNWVDVWTKFTEKLGENGSDVDAAIIASDSEPDEKQISFSTKPVQAITKIAASLWLGEAIISNNVVSYKQQVVSEKDKVVGYESFARVKGADGKIIAGGEIIEAARALGIEFALDRYLHVLAIKTYVQAALQGYLFINFFPGFIQRPEVYLEGLSEAVRMHGVAAKNIVLDFTESESQQDVSHLAKVTKYCREKGYAIALDDVTSVKSATKLISETKPDFIKLDRKLSSHHKRKGDIETLSQIILAAHKSGARVIAEGIETQECYNTLKGLEVDLFQGYYFSPPLAV